MFKVGDEIRIRRKGDTEWTPGIVDIASPNGQSLMVVVADPVFRLAIPLMVDYDKGTVRSLTGGEYEIDFRAPGVTVQ